MNKIRVFVGAVLPGLVVAGGCSSMNNTDKDTVAGAAAGGVVGGIIGHVFHNTAAGAVIGAVTGGITGMAIGSDTDKKQQQQAVAQAQANAQAAAQTGLAEVIQMTQAGIADSIIINKIRGEGVVFVLSANDITTLHQNGVSDAVINEMVETASRYPPAVYMAAPRYATPYGYSSSVYVVGPPVGVGYRYAY